MRCDDHVTDDVNYSGLFGDDDDDDEPEKEGDPGFQLSQKHFLMTEEIFLENFSKKSLKK